MMNTRMIILALSYLNRAANIVLKAPKLDRSNSNSWLSDSTACKQKIVTAEVFAVHDLNREYVNCIVTGTHLGGK